MGERQSPAEYMPSYKYFTLCFVPEHIQICMDILLLRKLHLGIMCATEKPFSQEAEIGVMSLDQTNKIRHTTYMDMKNSPNNLYIFYMRKQIANIFIA